MQTIGGATTLMYACQQCKEFEVLDILRKQPYSVKDRDRTLKTPLHYCAENLNTNCAEAVLEVAPELVNAQDENGYCTLHLAVIAGNKSLIKLLITKDADVNIHDNEGHSAVHWAIVSSEKDALEIIIRAGANPSTPDIHGGYPLHYAVQMCGSNGDYSRNDEDTLRVVEALLKFGVDVNVKDKDGRQPILWAASAGSADSVIHLVSGGACVEAADKDGLTALHCAASRGHTSTLETLISLCGANVDVIDGNGCSPLFYSVTLGHADSTELLLQLGADPNRQDRKGRTPAHCGAAKGQLETLRILKKHNGNLWMRNVRGDIPLHEAVASGRKDLVLWLLSQNSEAINIANNDGRCPLHIASMYNSTEMVKVLLDSKSLVNPVMRTSKGVLMTPLNVALCKGHRSCGKYLQLHGGVPFSKVSKVEPNSASLRISPSDDMMITTEVNKDNAKPFQSKFSLSRSFTDIQGNPKIVKTEAVEKKKVYRRRKKKRTSSNISSQNSDSEDSVHNLKMKTPDSRKNEENNENDNGNDEVGNDEDEDAIKLEKARSDNKTIKQEKSSKNYNIKRKTAPSRKSEISEEPIIVKRITKTKTASKPLQKNKSFNETKNVSDLSPEDFPPLMQTINQLDSVIMEPDVEVSKPENEDSEMRTLDTKTMDCGSAMGEIKKRKIIEKLDHDSRTVSGEALSNDEINAYLKRTDYVEDDKEIKKENLAFQEKAIKTTSKKPDGDFQKDEIVTKSPESKNSNYENENNFLESVECPKSSSKENFDQKISKTGKESNDGTEGIDVNEKIKTVESDRKGRTSSDSKLSSESGEIEKKVSSVIKSDNEISEGGKIRSQPEINSDGFNDKTIEEKLESGSDDLSEKGTNKEVPKERNMNEKEITKSDESANALDSLPIKEEVFAHIPTISFEKDIAEEIKTVVEKGICVTPSEKDEEKNFTEAKTLKAFDSPENTGTLIGKTEKPCGKVLSETEMLNPLGNSDSNETEKKSVTDAVEPNEETPFRTPDKRFAEGDQNSEGESKSFTRTLSIKKEEDFIHDKSEDSLSKVKDERDQILEQEDFRYEETKSGGEGSPHKMSKRSDRSQFKTPKVSRLCRSHRDFKEDLKPISVTQLVQNTIRKYHMERGIFYQLLELKRYQIRSGRANEQVLVKRLADEYEKSRTFLGMKPFSGLYRFREFEKFLYDQLKALNTRRSFIIPEIKSYDDIDTLSSFLKKSRYKIISDVPQGKMVCTCITQRCHHSACAYTSVPCSAYITDLRRHRHHKPRRECFFPRIDQRSPLKLQAQKFTERPATLELIQGSEKHVIMLPQSSPTRAKRYYVTFTIKGAPAFKKEDFLEDPKDYFKHRHAKSV